MQHPDKALTRRSLMAAGILGLSTTVKQMPRSSTVVFAGGLFVDFANLRVPVSTGAVQSIGYDRPGVGAALYREDPDQSATPANRRRQRTADGRWFVLAESVVSVMMTGARGDGRQDDTAAIQDAVQAALTVIVPATEHHYRITSPILLRSGQSLRGEGGRPRIVQFGAGQSAAALRGDHARDLTVTDLHLTPGLAGPNFFQGHAVHLRDCAGIRIERLGVSGHRRGGVTLQNCSGAVIQFCEIGASIVNPAVDDHSAAGYDILVVNGGSDVLITNNRCVGGAGIGIGVQSTAAAAPFVFRGIRIEKNVVDDQGCYGVLVYRSNDDRFEAIRVIDNTVSGISGAVRHTDHGRVFGAGIYIQGVDGTLIARNHVSRTNTATEVETLAPAGIGVANATAVTIEDNMVEDCRWNGVCVFDPNTEGSADGVALISRNVIRNNGKSGVYAKDIRAGRLIDNTVTGNGEHGFLALGLASRTTASAFDLHHNRFAHNLGQGVFFLGGDGTLSDNEIVENGGGGVVFGSAGRFQLTGNTVADNGAWGVSGVRLAEATLRDNSFRNNRAGAVSIQNRSGS